MTQATDSDIIEIKHLIGKLDRKVDLLKEEVTILDKKFQGLESKLWGLGFALLSASLAALVIVLG